MDQDQCYARAVRQAHSKLLSNAESFDVDVIVGGQTFPCHKFLLTLWSGYFDTLLQGEWKDSRGPVTLEEDEQVSAESFEALRDWIYKGLLNLSVDNVYGILACAHYLQIISALDACVSYIERMYENKEVKVSDMVKMVALAERYGLLRLQEVAFKFLLLNFEAVASIPDFLEHMTLDLLVKLLTRDDLVCSTEDVVFNASVAWLKHKEERLKFVGDIMIHLRLGVVDIITITDGIDFILMSNIKTPDVFNVVQAATLRECNPKRMTYLKENHPEMFTFRKTPDSKIAAQSTRSESGAKGVDGVPDNQQRSDIQIDSATFSFTVHNIQQLTGEIRSAPCFIRNLNWKILVMPTFNNSYVGCYVECHADPQSTSWTCTAACELKLLNKTGGVQFIERNTKKFSTKDYTWGTLYMISRKELSKPKCNYMSNDGSITLQAHVDPK